MHDDGATLLVRIGTDPVADAPAGRVDKRAAIVAAATRLFLEQGYQATSTEQIARAAEVSKQTVYNRFGDKDALFRAIVLGVTVTAERFAAEVATDLRGIRSGDEVEPALRALARRYLTTVMTPQVLALRRLVVAEASRFPDLAAAYHDRAPALVLTALGEQLASLAGRGLLALDDADRAAGDLAFLVLGRSLDTALFRDDAVPSPDEIVARADHAVTVFLAAYRP